MLAHDLLLQYRQSATTNALWNRNLCRLLNERPDLGGDRLYRILQHMLAADEVWLARFDGCDPDLACLQWTQCARPDEIWFRRLEMDEEIVRTVSAYSGPELAKPISYHDFRGTLQHEALGTCLARLFNHQQNHQFRIDDNLRRELESDDQDWNCLHYF